MIGNGQEARHMRHTPDPRPAGYPIAIVLLLVAAYCALAGSEWIGAALAGVGALVLVLLAFIRRTPGRSPVSTTTR
jgi:uncharacterized membrane protein (UPF0136 family)